MAGEVGYGAVVTIARITGNSNRVVGTYCGRSAKWTKPVC